MRKHPKVKRVHGVTEEEARKKWCPRANARITKDHDDLPAICCIGNDCMAWRWLRTDGVRGFCGLAGRG